MPKMPDNQIDWGASRRQPERDADVRPRQHAKQSTDTKPKPIRHRERSSTDSDDRDRENIRGKFRTQSRIAMLALTYDTTNAAYENHESEIGHRISRLTFSNIFTEARRALKVFSRVGVIDEKALAQFRRRNRD